jgi:hypothetical protein
MAKRFESKKLNKEDHAKVDKDANAARNVVESVGLLALAGVIIKKAPWKKIGSAIGKLIFKA